MTVKINNAFIRKIAGEKPEKIREFRDANLRGFVVRQQPTGFISYYAIASSGSTRRGNRRQKKGRIGEHPAFSPSEAREHAAQVIAKARLDNLPLEKEIERIRLQDFLEQQYCPWIEQHLKCPEGQKIQLRHFQIWRSLFLDEIDRRLVDSWRSKRLAADISANTVNRNVSVIRSVLSKAVEWEFLKHHPLEGLKPLRIDRGKPPRVLSDDEKRCLFEGLRQRDTQAQAKRRSANEWRSERGYNLFLSFHSLETTSPPSF